LCDAAGFARVFFGNSGAEANECAIKLARKYSHDTYKTERGGIVSLCNSFHGRTLTTLAATGQDSFHQHFFPFASGFSYAEAGNVQDLLDKVDETTCAVMLECIQGEGGVVPMDPAYLQEVRRICDQKDLLLIIDEVQTGVGRTGKLFAFQSLGVKPDIVTMAKGLGGGLPIGACLCTEALSGVLSAGMHGSTFGGNPIVCAGARVVLEKVTAPGFLDEIKEKGAYMRRRLKAMPHVKEVRGLGMMIGIVLDEGTAREVATTCLENGLLVLTAKSLVRLLPPLTITYDEIDKGLCILESVLKGAVSE
jgi:acetylornithine/N-succinyldiaminopimelate aminotransferase